MCIFVIIQCNLYYYDNWYVDNQNWMKKQIVHTADIWISIWLYFLSEEYIKHLMQDQTTIHVQTAAQLTTQTATIKPTTTIRQTTSTTTTTTTTTATTGKVIRGAFNQALYV